MSPATAVDNLRALYSAEIQRREEATRRGRALLPKLVRVLVEEYGALRVTLIGSLARGTFDQGSDIDLVVEGVALRTLFEAQCRLWDVAGFPVDVLRAEAMNRHVAHAIRSHGEVLHDSR